MVLAMDSTLLAWFVCSACYMYDYHAVVRLTTFRALWTTFDYLSEECGRKNDDIIICFSLSSFLVILAWYILLALSFHRISGWGSRSSQKHGLWRNSSDLLSPSSVPSNYLEPS